ncbi:unnamed protein product [Protopolystoma xenopodis]|uniref:Uncharacterized protein n=1 Tax=Protopolystoma xenopodis TaxID=117903 RepID=A0A3S5ANZ4_9PLAT|nr:unnamed protein product [Protopolystoma xenopodis]
MNTKDVVNCIKKALGQTNVGIRTAGINLAITLQLFMGVDNLRLLLADEKPSQLAIIDSEFSRLESKTAPVPIRNTALKRLQLRTQEINSIKKYSCIANSEAVKQEESRETSAEVAVNPEDLITRTDIW